MRPRPIYRWKSFWFGLLTLAFMGWVSWDSQRYWFVAWCGRGTAGIAGERINSASYIVWSRSVNEGFGIEHRAVVDAQEWDDYLWEKLREQRPRIGVVRVPDAAIFFPFLFAWIGWLGWRMRKLRVIVRRDASS